MKPALRLPVRIATHVVAFGAGWLLWSQVQPDAGEQLSPAVEGKAAGEGTERRRLREQAGSGGERVLKQLFGDGFKLSVANEDWGRSRHEHYVKLLADASEVAPSADRAQAARSAIDDFARTVAADDRFGASGEMTSRLIHWMQSDPDAAIAHLEAMEDNRVRKHVTYFLTQAAMAVTTQEGLLGCADWFKAETRNSDFSNQLRSQFARELGAKADLNEITAINQRFDQTGAHPILPKLLATSWPIEKAGDFLVLAKQDNSPDVLTDFAMKHGEEGARWFENLLAAGTLPPEKQEEIISNRAYGDFMLRNPSVDLERRLEVLAALNPGSTPEHLLFRITNRDIGSVLRNGPDYRFAFRNGSMTAEEVVNAVSSSLPQLAARSPEVIRAYLFGELAEEDGAKAMALLGNLPEEEKWKAAMRPVTSMFHGVNPQQFYDYLQHVPVDASPESVNERIKAWTNLGRENHARLGDGYLNWVKGLPDGPDKDMAALSIVESSHAKDRKLADEFAGIIKDDRIRQRIPWKP
ncbi:hypothetical protein OVA24_10255 [Luteolibacter sp. SL250]|uniref:hypothetical protein n=1 Tax=Luteolibacter sp. SL250 TaxID=2995170 RepID=UPI00226EBB2E|nr:hypothetical protein [Luteolibacter sp. SL250]WAC21767.1 hypothetical protein OVA24_10255 [Luteolibacter sp. SL250]